MAVHLHRVPLGSEEGLHPTHRRDREALGVCIHHRLGVLRPVFRLRVLIEGMASTHRSLLTPRRIVMVGVWDPALAMEVLVMFLVGCRRCLDCLRGLWEGRLQEGA